MTEHLCIQTLLEATKAFRNFRAVTFGDNCSKINIFSLCYSMEGKYPSSVLVLHNEIVLYSAGTLADCENLGKVAESYQTCF